MSLETTNTSWLRIFFQLAKHLIFQRSTSGVERETLTKLKKGQA